MEVILDEEKYDAIWDKIFYEYGFKPSCKPANIEDWIHFPMHFVKYKLCGGWSEEQERIVNSIMKNVINEEMYALNWKHDC